MSISVERQSKQRQNKFRKAYRPTSVLAKEVRFDAEMMHVSLTDGRIISVPVPVIWFPLLHQAVPEQHRHYEIGRGGLSLHWPEIDEDISVAGLMASVDWEAA
jgi:hypothetical protein